MTDRNGGYPASSPFAGGNPRPSNPGPDRVTCDPRAPTGPSPAVAPLAPRPRVNSDQFPAFIPGASPSRGTKPL